MRIALTLILLGIVPFTLAGLALRSRASMAQRMVWTVVVGAVIVLAAARLILLAAHNVHAVPVWDFLGFWFNAHVAAARENIYNPLYATELARSFAVTPVFRREIIDVGFWYPPGSIFIFLILALFANIHAAYAVWYAIQAAALILAIWLLARTFLREDGLAGVLAAAALTLALPAASSTVAAGQTNFLLLLGLALFWRAKERFTGGLWLGFAVLVKPLVAILVIPLLIRRWFAPVGGTVLVVVLATIAAGGIVPGALSAYLHANPSSKLPPWVYTEASNTSLLGAILRAAHPVAITGIPLPISFAVSSIVLLLISAWLCVRLRSDAADLAVSLWLVLGLLLYPVSQDFYAILLIVPLLVLWRRRRSFAWQSAGCIVLVTVLYLLQRLPGNGDGTVAAYGLLWVALAALCAPALERKGNAQRGQQADAQTQSRDGDARPVFESK